MEDDEFQAAACDPVFGWYTAGRALALTFTSCSANACSVLEYGS